MKPILIVIATLLVLPMVGMLLNPWLGLWACKVMGWHLRPRETGFDGASATGTCPRCSKVVLQDSQGNWFLTTKEL